MNKIWLVVLACLLLAGCAERGAATGAPVSSDVQVLRQAVTDSVPQVLVTLAPVGVSDKAAVSAASVIAKCTVKGDAGAVCADGKPDSVTLARLTDLSGVAKGQKYTDALVWVLQWNNIDCMRFGPHHDTPAPRLTVTCTFRTLIDATTGDYLKAYSL